MSPGPSNNEDPQAATSTSTQASSSSSSRRERRPESSTSYRHLDSSVTRLLVATKFLLEGLQQWSTGRKTEMQVSDIYVQLGNDFNLACAGFERVGIDMSELYSVPDDLRHSLETCLSEEATPANLEVHLPRIREIIISLLQGLKQKQNRYRSLIKQQQQQQKQQQQQQQQPTADDISAAGAPPSSSSRQAISPSPTLSPDDARNRRSHSHSHSHSSSSSSPIHSPTQSSSIASVPAREDSKSPRPPGRPHRTSPRPAPPLPEDQQQQASSSSHHRPSASTSSSVDIEGDDGAVSAAASVASQRRPSSTRSRPSKTATLGPSSSYSPTSTPNNLSPSSSLETVKVKPSISPPLPPLPPDSNKNGDGNEQQRMIPGSYPSTTPSPSASSSNLPVPQIDLPPPLPPASPPNDSLEALKKSEGLQRRASKRFSSYTFSKMTSSANNSMSAAQNLAFLSSDDPASPAPKDSSARELVNASRRNSRSPNKENNNNNNNLNSSRSLGLPSSPAVSKGKRSSKSTSASDNTSSNIDYYSLHRTSDSSSSSANSYNTTSNTNTTTTTNNTTNNNNNGSHANFQQKELSSSSSPQLPPVNEGVELKTPASTTIDEAKVQSSSSSSLGSTYPQTPTSFPIFLQIGRQVKKVYVESTPSLSSLRMLFTERFQYSSYADFPGIYIRDPLTGIQYELEDVSEIKENSVLSLNIEPLDEVKSQIDQGLAGLARELKEMKAAFTFSRRASNIHEANALYLSNASNAAATHETGSPRRVPLPPSRSQSTSTSPVSPKKELKSADTTFATAADNNNNNNVDGPQSDNSQAVAHSPTSVATPSARSFTDFNKDIENMRREIGTLRQIQVDFTQETRAILDVARVQVAKVRELAHTKIGGGRALVETGKKKLDDRSQNVLTKIEALQDTIDDLKTDVTARRMLPKPNQVASLEKEIHDTHAELESIGKFIESVRPEWKRTWHAELQNLVEEQQLLKHQEELHNDLLADHNSIVQMLNHIKKYLDLRSAQGRSPREFVKPDQDGHQGMATVMLEVKGQTQDSDRRLKAIEATETKRIKDLQSRKDEFAQELSGFVDNRMLKRTGGTEEVDRIREQRDLRNFKTMFSTAPPPSTPMTTSNSGSGGSGSGSTKSPTTPTSTK